MSRLLVSSDYFVMAVYKLVCERISGKRRRTKPGRGGPGHRAKPGRAGPGSPATRTDPAEQRKRESPMSAAEGPLVVGVDTSTQSTKALVVDASTGQVVASGQAPHTVTSGAGRESDPRQWWDALTEALHECGEAAREAAAVSIGGQQHGLVTLDAQGDPVRPALLWNDVRSAPQARRLIEELGGPKAWAERIGSVPG